MRAALLTGVVALCAVAVGVLNAGPTSPDLDTADRINISLVGETDMLDRLSQALQHKTVSSLAAEGHVLVPDTFKALHTTPFDAFPEVFKTLDLEVVSKYSLMLTWPGSNPKLRQQPTVFISHIDVVAAGDAEAEAAWTHGPFSGKIADGYVWGRGALDVKVTVTAMLEAVTHLLRQGFKPERTAVFAFGHDEEVAGTGASSMARLLKQKGMEAYLILDEGGFVLADGLPPIVRSAPVAIVSVAEKGYMSIDMSVKGEGGHSSMPPVKQLTVVEQLGNILQKLHANPPPTRLVLPVPGMLKELSRGSTSGLVQRLLGHCDTWGLRSLIPWALARASPELAALVRTTRAVTDLSASPPGHNVIPDTATAHVNFRTLPGEDPEYASKYLHEMARKAGAEVQLHVYDSKVPSVVTDVQGVQYRQLKAAILETLAPPSGMIVAPELLAGVTDSAYWAKVFPSTPILRFTPNAINRTAGDLKRIHGVDERVGCSAYLNAVRFYVRYMQTSL